MQKKFHIPLKQPIGSSSRAIVSVGDIIKKGAVVAVCQDGMFGAKQHASIAGKVTALTDNYVEIEADEQQEEDYIPIQGDSILELIQAAGLVGMGGAGFPTHQKLIKLDKDPIVIVNAVECEPILEHNITSIEQNPTRIYKGVLYAMKAVNSKRGIIALKEIHRKAIKALTSVINDENITISLLPNTYPMGEERAVIRETLGILLDVDQIPIEAGVIVINSETASRITDAVEIKKPVISKDITVAGKINNTILIHVLQDVPIGTRVKEIIEQLGGMSEDCGEILLGGPFTGQRGSLDSMITKTTGGIILTMPFIKEKRKMGLLVCACGARQERLSEIAKAMGAEVIGVEYCKQAIEVRGNLKCQNPGKCPGQSQKVLALKKAGADVILISNCTDCTNTVMSIAPQLKMPVYHCTDGALRAVNIPLIRKVKLEY